MKTLYININNEQNQSNDELEVLNYDLDNDFFFYLGEKIAKGCKVENKIALITGFNTHDSTEDYQKIIAQWNEIKTILFSEKCEGKFKFTLPNGYIHWLRYSEKYNYVYDKNFSHGESPVISIDLEELYEESIEDMQRKILRTLKRNDLYLEVDEIVFNDDAVTRKSLIVRAIKGINNSIRFKAYEKWKEDYKPQENIPDMGGSPIRNGEDDSKDDLTLLVNWICDAAKQEKGIDWRNDKTMMNKIYGIAKEALDKYNSSSHKFSVDIWVPYVNKYDAQGLPIHTTAFKKTLSKGVLHLLKHPEDSEPLGWEFVESLANGLILKKHNKKYGLVTYDGCVVASCEYNEILLLKSGDIRLQKDGKFGLINKDWIIIPCIYDELLSSEGGLYKVKEGCNQYKIDCNGKKKYVKIDKEWLYLNKNGEICDSMRHIMNFFPMCGIIVGQTHCSQLNRTYTRNAELTLFGRSVSGKTYTENGNENIVFWQFDDDEYISSVVISRSSEEYTKVKTTLRRLNYDCIFICDSQGIACYQSPDQSLKILISNLVIIIQHFSASCDLIGDIKTKLINKQ